MPLLPCCDSLGVELGFNYPWPIITPDAAKQGVAMAASVVERCAPSSGSSGSSTGTGYNSLLPRKEPYRCVSALEVWVAWL